MTRGVGRPNRWPRTPDGRYKCTDCEKTYAHHNGAWKHYNLHHAVKTNQTSLFPDLNQQKCAKKNCANTNYKQFHLCEKHLLMHENNAWNFVNRMYDVNDSGCWIFKGSTNQLGYAQGHSYNLHSRGSEVIVGVYKLSLYLHNRQDINHDLHDTPLSQYGDVHHKCKIRNCLNPDHLTEMSENIHQVMHNLSIERIAKSVLDEFVEHYPHLESKIEEIKSALNP